jgi:AcrR family transcriptional regulator
MLQTVDIRTTILEAAERLLDASPDRDISTRSVCEAASVSAPMLYRLFGDKNGLLKAVVDYGFDRYLAGKRVAPRSDDPVADLRNGWDSHVAFALSHPAVYRLMYSSSFDEVPNAAGEAMRLLCDVLDRCAAAGRLRIPTNLAAQAVMSANIGVALSLVTQPSRYHEPDLSSRVRDAVHRAILAESEPRGRPAKPANDLAPAALQLSALLAEQPVPLSHAESRLLREWLARIAAAPDPHKRRTPP